MPNYRKLGVGSTLFTSVAERGFKSGCKRMDFLVMDQSAAGGFYKSKGAIDITEEEGWHHFRLDRDAMKNLSQETAREVLNGICK
ncbi:hypothetical protein C0J52_02136 [Blattella germanica]|nr:hypothetical protein C0J52_02136 [Blattella germanica]